MGRYKHIDIARGIGMILVVAGHAVGISMYLTCFFMQLFFVLSGYVYKQGKSYKENVKRKAERLLIPYFSGSIALLIIYKILGRTSQETIFSGIGILYSRYCFYNVESITDKENIFFLNIANGATWYLTALFTAGVIYYWVIDACIESKKRCIGCILSFLVVSMCLNKLPVLLPWSVDIAFSGAILMIIGTLLERKCDIRKWKKRWIFLIAVLYFVLATFNPGINISVRKYGAYGNGSIPLFILIGICGSVLCMWIGTVLESVWIGKIFAYIGRNTVFILVFHMFILQIIETMVKKIVELPTQGSTWNFLYQIARITIAITGCLVFNKCFETGKKCVQIKRKGI